VVFGAIAAAATIVLVFGRVGKLHGRTTRLYVTTGEARGVIAGTDVWLDGEKVGRVEWVRFRPPATDTAERLLIALDVFASIQPLVRHDTRAQIRPGSSLIGVPVVHLVGGTPNAPEVAAGDTLVTSTPHQFDGAREQIAQVAQDFPLLLDNFQTVRTQLFATTGTIGALSSDSGAREFRLLNRQASHLSVRAMGREGTLGRLADSDLVVRAQRALAAADSVRQRVSARTSTVTGLGNDSSLARSIRDTRVQLDLLRAELGAPAADSTAHGASRPGSRIAQLRQRVAATAVEMHDLEADIARRPLRYFVF
jgi:MlaD protein